MKSSVSLLLALSFGVLQSIATPTFRLDVSRNPISGCVNITTCSYGCDRFSTISVKHVLTPLCKTKSLPEGAPRHLTIRGTSMRPYLFDEDMDQEYECSKIRSLNGTQFICAHITEEEDMNPSSSSMMMSSHSSIHSDLVSSMTSMSSSSMMHSSHHSTKSAAVNMTTCEEAAPSTIFSTVTITEFATPSNSVCVNGPGVYGMSHGNGNLDDCCQTSNDCHGSCIKGACDAEHNKPPPPTCTNIKYKGKKNGMGPEGVCCDTQADCLESCVANICSAIL
jgi:hypothetical protein